MKKSMKKLTVAATVLSALTFNLSTVSAQTWSSRSSEEIFNTLSQSNQSGIYIIQWGDTLSTIAEATGYSVEQLASLNAIHDAHVIYAGSVLYFNQNNETVTFVDASTQEATTQALEETAHYIVEETPEWIESTEEITVVNLPEVDEATQSEVIAATLETLEETLDANEVLQEDLSEVEEASVVQESETEVEEEIVEEAPIVEEIEPIIEEVIEEVVAEEPVAEEEPTVIEEVVEVPVEEVQETEVTSSEVTGVNEYGGIYSEAKEWIAMRESGGVYDIWNPSGKYYGRYQLTVSYLNGDLSPENQERVADQYVLERYGSWEAAKAFWEINHWY